jgi:para-nitrobenzyl esterase
VCVPLQLKGRKLGMMPFQPVMDGEILEQPIVEALRAGAAQELDAMVGYTKEEELLFNHIMPWQYTCQNEGDLLRKVCKMLGPEMLDVEEHEEVAQRVVGEVKDWAAGAATAEQESAAHLWTRLAIEASSACKFAVPAHVLAEALVGRCRAVYMFRVDVHSPALRGAAHALDLPYVFDNCAPWGRLVPPDAQANAQLCEAVNGAWVGFATKGDPNAWAAGGGATRSHLPPWPTLTGEDPCQLMVVDLPLAKCRVQHVPIHKAYPQLWEIVNTNVRAMWFLRPLNGNSEEKSAL